jgi:hypothetical protein
MALVWLDYTLNTEDRLEYVNKLIEEGKLDFNVEGRINNGEIKLAEAVTNYLGGNLKAPSNKEITMASQTVIVREPTKDWKSSSLELTGMNDTIDMLKQMITDESITKEERSRLKKMKSQWEHDRSYIKREHMQPVGSPTVYEPVEDPFEEEEDYTMFYNKLVGEIDLSNPTHVRIMLSERLSLLSNVEASEAIKDVLRALECDIEYARVHCSLWRKHELILDCILNGKEIPLEQFGNKITTLSGYTSKLYKKIAIAHTQRTGELQHD